MRRGVAALAGLAAVTVAIGLLTRPLVHALRADTVGADLGILPAPSSRARIVDEHVLAGIEAHAFGRELRLRLDRPARRVNLEPFLIDRCEVRQIDFERFANWYASWAGPGSASGDSTPLAANPEGAGGSASPLRPPVAGHAPRPARQHVHRTSHRGAAELARDRRRLHRCIPLLHGGRGTTAVGGRARGGRRRHRRTALCLGRRLRFGTLALPRRLAQRVPALRRSPARGLAARGARSERQRDGMERGQSRGAAGAQAAGRARRARGPRPCTSDLRAQRGLASHRAGHPQSPPRLSLRLRLAAARESRRGAARQARTHGSRAGRIRSVSLPTCAWPGSR